MGKELVKIKIPSTDNKNNLQVYVWETDEKPQAILQISHGMKEHILRYEEFAKFMVSRGVLVIGNDHLGHGLTAKDENDLGYFGSENSKTVVDDLHAVTLYAKETYGSDIPFFMLGHSMGSFMARRYIMTYGKELSGVIISGTGSTPGALLSVGRFLTFVLGKIKGDRQRPALLKNMAFGAYNKRIENPESESAWLCKDKAIVEKYDNDKFCTFDFTTDGYKTLFESIAFIQKKSNIEKIPKDLPVLFISGTEDPVGDYGKGVEKAYDEFEKAMIKDCEIVLYHGGRHEMLNEIEREGVFEDIDVWIKQHIK